MLEIIYKNGIILKKAEKNIKMTPLLFIYVTYIKLKKLALLYHLTPLIWAFPAVGLSLLTPS